MTTSVAGVARLRLPRLLLTDHLAALGWAASAVVAVHAPMAMDHRAFAGYGRDVFAWSAMVLATMMIVVRPAAHHVAANTLRRRRSAAVVTFVGTYSALWISAGLAAVALTDTGARPLHGHLASLALGVAGAYQFTAVKQRVLRSCHRTTPLAIGGPAAARSWAGFGVRHGSACVASCAPLMIAASVAPGGMLVWSAVSVACVVGERRARRPRAASRTIGTCLCLVALLTFAAGL